MTAKMPVYVVDDDDAVRRSVSFMLKVDGYSAVPFESGNAFLEAMGELKPGCILLDLRMPGLDGFAVLEQLNERGCELPVVIATGHGEMDAAAQAINLGALAFLEKPYRKEQLMQVLARAGRRLANEPDEYDHDESRAKLAKLSESERQILDGLADGLTNAAIAANLGTSIRAVEVHRAVLMEKLGISSAAEMIRIALGARKN